MPAVFAESAAGMKREVRTTSRKLKRLIEEEEKTIARIAELQEYLKKIRETRKNEEDQEIIKSIRSMKLGARDLFDLLTAIQSGNLSEEVREQLLSASDEEEAVSEPAEIADGREADDMAIGTDKAAGGMDHTDSINEDPDFKDEVGAEEAPEREGNRNDRHHD